MNSIAADAHEETGGIGISLRTQLVLLIASTMTVMAGAVIAPAIPFIQQHFSHVPNSELLSKLVLTMPALFIAIGSSFAGMIADRWGRKPLLIVSLLIYGVTGAAGFALDSLEAILVSRALLGLAVSGIMTGATTLIGDYFDGPARSRFMGIQSSFMAFGAVVFVTSGGVLADLGWQFPFLVYISGLALAPVASLVIAEPLQEKTSNPVDAEEAGQALPWRTLIQIYAVAFISMVIFYMVPAQFPFHLKNLLGAGGMQVGVAIAAANLVTAAVSFNYGRIKKHFSFQGIFAAMFILVAAGYFLVSIAGDYVTVLIAMIISGVGLGLLFANLSVWLVTSAPAAVRGRAVGGMATFIFLGQFSSPILLQPIVAIAGIAGSFAFMALFQVLMAALFGFAALRRRTLPAPGDSAPGREIQTNE